MFMEEIEKNEAKVTENGALGFVTSGHKIVDLNFAIPSYRNNIDKALFEQAFNEDRNLTLKWLLYLRDVRNGVGERKSFRDFMQYLCSSHEEIALKFIENIDIAEYGRWDDYVYLYFAIKSKKIKDVIINIIKNQLKNDLVNCKNEKNVSLLAKWMPSVNASSENTKKQAKILYRKLGMKDEKTYRSILSVLRKYIDVVETKMSSNKWDEIEYSTVPSKANLNYGDAFMRHDYDRRVSYLFELEQGKTKINAQAMFLHDIVHKYGICSFYGNNTKEDATLEALWKAQNKVDGFKNTLVVRDGSASMTVPIGNSNVSALDVASAIALYCAQNNSGEFKNKFITFSATPKIVTVNSDTLFGNLNIMRKYNECSNTNIQAVFGLILETARNSHMKQEDMPESILIISDMEFDGYSFNYSAKLFNEISNDFKRNGYIMPKLIFWNVNSRTNTIPISKNEMGVILISGFSKNLMNMVMSSEIDPYKALVNELNVERYSIVDTIFK